MVSAIGFKLNCPDLITGFGHRRRVHAGSYRLTGGRFKKGPLPPEVAALLFKSGAPYKEHATHKAWRESLPVIHKQKLTHEERSKRMIAVRNRTDAEKEARKLEIEKRKLEIQKRKEEAQKRKSAKAERKAKKSEKTAIAAGSGIHRRCVHRYF